MVFPFAHTSLLADAHCNELLIEGLGLLVFCQYWNLTETSFRYPVVTLYNGDPVVLDLLDWPLKPY